jgi:2-amino-4-hydroxy-6-hydroxymethyldihydropteridine diphosphokinase
MYVADQPDFLNAVVRGFSRDGPLRLMRRLKRAEERIGRTPGPRYGPRKIDLDLVLYGRLTYCFIDSGRTILQVPHVKLTERRFVLQPLSDLAPGLELPGLGQLKDLLEKTNGQASDVLRFDNALLPVPRQK